MLEIYKIVHDIEKVHRSVSASRDTRTWGDPMKLNGRIFNTDNRKSQVLHKAYTEFTFTRCGDGYQPRNI